MPRILTSPNCLLPKSCTETALLHITNRLLESADQGCVSILSQLELSAAFDTPDYSIFLERLHTAFEISGSSIQWIHSYIFNRCQVVVVNGISSTPRCPDCGVQPVSVLGPMLFVIDIKPTSCIIGQCDCDRHKFSDDTQLFSSAPLADFGTLIKQTEHCAQHIMASMESNKLKLNNDKTEAIVLSTHSRTSISCGQHLEIGSSLIPFQPKVKNMGVVLDSSHTICEHISSVCCSAYLELFRVSATCPFLTKDVTASLVCA